MLYGTIDAGTGIINYAVSTDNGEGGMPLSYDLNYRFGGGDFIFGVSGYTSGRETTSDVGVGEGSPNTGVLPWMAADNFNIFGGYVENKIGNLTLQFEYWRANHAATRDPASVVQMIDGANPNANQLARFLKDPNAAVAEDNVNLLGDYNIKTWYLRAGYTIETDLGDIGPYFHFDFYDNPETIQSKTFGGDAIDMLEKELQREKAGDKS